jgi:arylsulfatase A-like enzyme/cytochrome c-type biogenesis protein CcmH/NrfG
VSTPALDALARRGVWFTKARTVVPLTLPSHATLLSGLHPARHGVRNNGSYRLDPGIETLAEILGGRGWRTGAIVGSFVLDAQFGLAQGFEVYDGPLSSGAHGEGIEGAERTASTVTDAALRWLERPDARPFFLWVHYYDPHAPYDPPEPFRSRHQGARYDGEVEYVDQEVGRLLRAIAARNTGAAILVAAAGDHGESLGEHGESTHGLFLYEAVLRVPLILAGPGVPARGADAREASTLDLLPTLLPLLRVPPPGALPGFDLLAEAGPRAAGSQGVVAETLLPCQNYGWSGSEAIVAAPLKLILGSAPELYDLEADPGEGRDLAARRPADSERLEALLQQARARLSAPPAPGAAPAPRAAPDAETRAQLESLGYLAGGARPAAECRSGPDPRRQLPVLAAIDLGVAEYRAARYEQAAAAFGDVARRDPGNLQAHFYLGTALKKLGRIRDAVQAFSAAARLDPDNLVFLQDEAAAWFDAGETGRAERLLRLALQRHPGVPKTRFFLGEVLQELGRSGEALSEYEAARAAMPPSAELEFQRGRALVSLGRRPEAIEALRQACALAPDASEWRGTLAGLLAGSGRGAEGVALLREFLARRPNDALALYNLAALLESAGGDDEALDLYRNAERHWSGDRTRLEAIRARIRALEGTSAGRPPRFPAP